LDLFESLPAEASILSDYKENKMFKPNNNVAKKRQE